MNFTVIWDDDAEARLAAIYLTAADKNAVSRAAYVLEQRLQTDPANAGESREAGERVTFVKPLGIRFKVVAGRTVRVDHDWTYR